MIRTLLLVAVIACGGDRAPAPLSSSVPPSPSTPPALAGRSPEERCEAVAERAIACLREIMIADASKIDPEIGRDMAAQIDREGFRKGEARALHDANCHASRTDTFPESVVACWAQPTCDAFVTCVDAAEDRAAAARPRPAPAD